MQKKIMLLGGGTCQASAPGKASLMGIETVLGDYYENPPAKALCVAHEQVSTFDIDACLKAAKKHKVDGVITLGTDQPVLTCASIAEELNLPYPISKAIAVSVTNKRIMKQIFVENSIPTLPFALISKDFSEAELSHIKPPYVLKPVDSQGQRGIFKLNSVEEIRQNFNTALSFSRDKVVLVEEFYRSTEVTVSGFCVNGEPHILTVTDRMTIEDDTHIGVCMRHRFPSQYAAEYYESICSISHRLAMVFEIKNGPFYFQMLLGDRGVVVNEIACRIGGAFEDVFIPLVTGFDILEAVLLQNLGLTPNLKPLETHDHRKKEPAISVELIFSKPGKIQCLTPCEEIKKLPFVIDFGYNFKEGDVLGHLENASTRLAYAVLMGKDESCIEKLRKQFYAVYKPIIEPCKP